MPTNIRTVPPARQTAIVENTPDVPGAGTVSSSPPVCPSVPPSSGSLSRRMIPSLPDWAARLGPRIAGAVEPRSTSPPSSCAWLRGVQLCRSRAAFAESINALSPQYRRPSKRALPVATSRLPEPGTTTAPERAQIAESLCGHEDGAISVWRSLQSEFQTCTIRPRREIVTTWP